MANDEMGDYFAFGINGLEYIMEKLNLLKQKDTSNVKSQ